MMKVNLKTFLLGAVILASALLVSCTDDDDTQPRTEADELLELSEIIDDLKNNGVDVQSTASGVYYIVYDEGEGNVPEAGDTLSIQYIGYFTTGNSFDDSFSRPDSLWTFTYKDPESPLIEGFEDGLGLMKKGSRYDLIIPSSLAYGDGGGYFPTYQTLLFSVKMKDIIVPEGN